MIKVLFFTLTFLSLSCANTQIKSSDNVPLSFKKQENFDNEIDIQITKEFFLWGLIPRVHEIDIDKEILNKGVNSATELVVEHKNRTSDVVWSLLTFGVYYPQTFHLKAKTSIR